MKKRVITSLVAALTVFGVVFAMAASLGGINSSSLGADDAVVASCDTNGVSTSYTVSYNSTSPAGYKVTGVSVSGIAAACDGGTMKVVLTGSGNASLGEVTSTVSGTSTTLDFSSSNVLAESVTGVHVVIEV
jgi:hypothetical protein